MTTEFKLPELGENIVKATVVGVLVSVGDAVKDGQGVLEVETDKAVIEVPSSVTGTVTAVHIREGEDIKIGQLLLTVDEGAAEAAPEAKPADEPAPPAQQPAPAAAPAAQVTVASAPPPQPATAEKAPEPAAPPATPEATPPSQAELVAAAPAVRRFARELGVEINSVTGTGPYGRVTMDDVKAFV
ncbi:MAG: E3 binding domain-containing protein, partial [Anaerolineae bacterium]|nr:E3 binding domain-containing protein [Anaerolineae bacterium]